MKELKCEFYNLLNIQPNEIFYVRSLPNGPIYPFPLRFSFDLTIKQFKENLLMKNGGYWEYCPVIDLKGFFNGMYKIVKAPELNDL